MQYKTIINMSVWVVVLSLLCGCSTESGALPGSSGQIPESISESSPAGEMPNPASSESNPPSLGAGHADLAADPSPTANAESADTPQDPLNTNDKPDYLDLITYFYVQPIYQDMFAYSWSHISEIEADHLLLMCGMNNYLNLSRDFEGVYNQPVISAELVEWAIQQHFDVDSAYLKTSQFYNAEDDTYSLVGGFGGGATEIAISAEQQGSQMVIEVGRLHWMEFRELEPGEILTDKGVLRPLGTLTVETVYSKSVKYISFVRYDGQ